MGTRCGFATRHYGSSPDTISRWAKAYAAGRVPNLEPSNRWPKHVRQPTTPPEVMVRIQGVTGAIPKMVEVEATGTPEPWWHRGYGEEHWPGDCPIESPLGAERWGICAGRRATPCRDLAEVATRDTWWQTVPWLSGAE